VVGRDSCNWSQPIPKLAEEFDAGYRPLLDKDHLTDGLKPPTYTAYIPAPPAETDYMTVWSCFFTKRRMWPSTCVARRLDGGQI